MKSFKDSRTQEDKDFILSYVDEPYSIENFIDQKDVNELIDIWENSDNKEHKNTGVITYSITDFSSPVLHKIRDKIYFDSYPNIEIWHAMFFYTDEPHMIHIDDSMDSFPKIYKAFNLPLRARLKYQTFNNQVPDLMFLISCIWMDLVNSSKVKVMKQKGIMKLYSFQNFLEVNVYMNILM